MNIVPGKILEVKGHAITIKRGERLLRLIEHNCDLALKNGDYLQRREKDENSLLC
jgi:hypothetical protein